MDALLTALRAAAEPSRLRLLALVAQAPFCVHELTDILGQSQPRLSRHLRLLVEAGLLSRSREGANVWFALAEGLGADLAREILARLPPDAPLLQADRRQAARVLAERARNASECFRRQGAAWDESSELGLSSAVMEDTLLALLPEGKLGRVLDIGTGTGRLLERLAPRISFGLGIDASREMLALARARLADAAYRHCRVQLADMYRLPQADANFDLVVLQMVLHYAEEPAAVLHEAARVLRPEGWLVVVDLAPHDRVDIAAKLAHRWQGFAEARMTALLRAAGLAIAARREIAAPLPVSPLPVSPLSVSFWAARPAAALVT